MGNTMISFKTAHEAKTVSAKLARNTKTNLFRCLWAIQFESALNQYNASRRSLDYKTQLLITKYYVDQCVVV